MGEPPWEEYECERGPLVAAWWEWEDGFTQGVAACQRAYKDSMIGLRDGSRIERFAGAISGQGAPLRDTRPLL